MPVTRLGRRRHTYRQYTVRRRSSQSLEPETEQIADNDSFVGDNESLVSENLEGNNDNNWQSLDNPVYLRLKQQFVNKLSNVHTLICEHCKEKTLVKYNPGQLICHSCRNRLPVKYTAENNMDPGPIPAELEGLTHIEQLLIAQVNPTMTIFRLPRGGQCSFQGHVLNIPQDIQGFVSDLPRTVDQLDVLVLRRQSHDAALQPRLFTVRREKVLLALQWLQRNNIYYHNITINERNLQQLPIDGLIELSAEQIHTDNSDGINEAAVVNNPLPDNTPSNPMPESFVPVNLPQHTEQEVIQAALENEEVLHWPRSGNEPVNEFTTVGYLARAFPCLYPTGAADIRAPRQIRVTQSEYFKHMLKYFDGRFEKNPRFLFLAFNSCLRWQSLQVGKVFVRNNPVEAPLSIQDIQALSQTDQRQFAARILRYGSSLRGTPQYWFSQKSNLLSMTKQLGKATIFFTFSMADLQWPDLEAILDHSNQSRAQAIAQSPYTTDAYVSMRFELFFKHFLIPYFEIKDYWYRYEWQNRGSLHVHGLAWLQGKPDTSECSIDEIVQFTNRYVSAWNTSMQPDDDPANFFRAIEVHPCSIKWQDVENLDEDLKQLINTCQRHTRCSPAYCLRENAAGQQQCRYKFPKALQQHTTAEFTLSEAGVRTKVDVKPARNDPYLNTYNAHCLSTHRANMDINVIFDLTDVANYIAKYTAKAEQASHNYLGIYQNIIANELPQDASFQRSVNALLMKTVGNMDVSAQQAAHICSGRPLMHCSREFVPCYVNGTTLDDQVNGAHLSDVRKYMMRPANYENDSLLEMLKCYRMKVTNNNVVCTRRTNEAVVRVMPYLSSSPTSQNYSQFCMQYLILRKPFRQWQDLTAGYNGPIEAFRAFSQDEIADGDDISQAVEQAVDMLNDEPLGPPPERRQDPWMEALNNINRNNHPEPRPQTVTDWAATSGPFQHLIRSALNFIQEAKAGQQVGHYQGPQVDPGGLNEDQRKVFDFIAGYQSSEPINALVLGSAGTGKSYLIHCLKQHLKESCIVLAPTGVAALNIKGETIHSFFMFSKASNVSQLKLESLSVLQNRCRNIKYVIIDEVSMIGCRLLNIIDMRMRQAFPLNSQKFFGGCNVIMLGDLGQLPPVADSRLFHPNRSSQSSLQGHAAYTCFNKVFFLTSCVRQADDQEFRDMLLRMRDGVPNQHDYDLFSSRFTGVIQEGTFDNAIRLFPTTAEVQGFNQQKLTALAAPIAHIESAHSSPQATTMSSNNFSGLERYLSMAVGAKVMLRANLWTQGGLVNGSVGKVLHIVYAEQQQPPSLPAMVICQFPSYTGPSFLPDIPHSVPIVPISRQCTGTDNSVVQRIGLPLSLSWALTIHKCQGLTLDKAVVSLGDNELSSGISFVALSRVRHICDLLIHPFPFDRIEKLHQSQQMQQRVREEDRLKRLTL